MRSQVVHGLSIPLGKLGFYLPRTISRNVMSSSSDEPDTSDPFTIGSRVTSFALRRRHGGDSGNETDNGPERSVFRIGGSVIPRSQHGFDRKLPDRREEPGSNGQSSAFTTGLGFDPHVQGPEPSGGRAIRFPDEVSSADGQPGEAVAGRGQ